MSYNWMLVRGASANPSSLKFAALMNKQSIAENEVFKPETQQPAIISTHTEDCVILQDPFFFKKLKTKTQKYYGPWEPDGVLLKYWCRFNHIARKMKDESFSGNYTYPVGNPKLCQGPDDGVKGGRIISRVNSKEESVDYYYTPDAPGIRVVEATNGFSIYLEFIPESLRSWDEELDPTIEYKMDSGNANGVRIRIAPDSARLCFIVLKSGVQKIFESPDNTVTPNTLHRCCFTYNPTGDIQTVRINNIPQTDSGNASATFPTNSLDLLHGMCSKTGQTGRFQGRILDSRWYNFIFNNDHQDNIWNNGRSICAAPAINLDGVNDDIDCGNDATLWSQALTKFSWSMWVYPTLLTDGTNNRDILRHGATGGSRFRCDLNASDSDVKWYIRNIADTADATARTDGMVLNKWQQLIGSYNKDLGTDNVRIYRNGVLGYQTANLTETLSALSITLSLANITTDFQGAIKDFKWWTTHAVNTDEAELIFANKYTVQPDFWLKMNEGNGNPVDWIGRTKLGTLTNGAAWVIHSDPYPTEYGSLAVAGYSRFNDTIDAGGYDVTGYDDTGFDTQ